PHPRSTTWPPPSPSASELWTRHSASGSKRSRPSGSGGDGLAHDVALGLTADPVLRTAAKAGRALTGAADDEQRRGGSGRDGLAQLTAEGLLVAHPLVTHSQHDEVGGGCMIEQRSRRVALDGL